MLETAGSGQISVGFQLRLGNSTCTIWSHLPTMTRLLRNICVSCFVYGGWLVGSEGCLRMGLQCRRVCEVPWVTPHWVPVASFGEGKSPVVFEALSSSDRAILQSTESWRTCVFPLPGTEGLYAAVSAGPRDHILNSLAVWNERCPLSKDSHLVTELCCKHHQRLKSSVASQWPCLQSLEYVLPTHDSQDLPLDWSSLLVFVWSAAPICCSGGQRRDYYSSCLDYW